MRLSDRNVSALPPPGRGQKLYPDDRIPGFGLRVSQGGTRSFVLVVGEDRQRITLGRYPIASLAQAREKAKTILAQRQLGVIAPRSPLFSVVHDEYLAQREQMVRASTRRNDTHLFRQFDGLAKRRIADISARDIEKIIGAIPARWTRTSAFHRASGLFRYAVKRGYIDKSPLDALEPPKKEESRDRVLTHDELARVLATSRLWRLGGHFFGSMMELLVLTGQRRQQIARLNVSFVDFDAGTITWPPELMKTGKRHTIPMSLITRSVLSAIPYSAKGLYFPSRVGTPFAAWDDNLKKFRADCGFADWRLHDVRRTLATRWQEMGIEIATTEKLLSHSAVTGGLVGIYQRSTYLAQMRSAVQSWEEYLEALLSKAEV